MGLGCAAKIGARAIPQRIFDLFPVLKQMMKRRGGDLSGGQQQQLAIGRALVLEPKLLILDEPTEGIQPNIVHEIGDIVLRLNKEEGLTVLLGRAEASRLRAEWQASYAYLPRGGVSPHGRSAN